MKKIVQILIALSLFLYVASFATCYFGVDHAVNQIPPEARNQMTDTDWTGTEWIGRGILLMICATSAGFAAIGIYYNRKKSQ